MDQHGNPWLPDRANVGGVILKKVPEGRTPEHYLWKRVLEKEWAGTFTLARLTGYKYRIGLDPAFVCEQPQHKKGQLHWYEWILCSNGGVISLYDEREMVVTLLTTAQTAAKVLGEVGELALAFDERLAREVRFPLAALDRVCELAGARLMRQVSEEQKVLMRERAKKGMGFLKGRLPTPG